MAASCSNYLESVFDFCHTTHFNFETHTKKCRTFCCKPWILMWCIYFLFHVVCDSMSPCHRGSAGSLLPSSCICFYGAKFTVMMPQKSTIQLSASSPSITHGQWESDISRTPFHYQKWNVVLIHGRVFNDLLLWLHVLTEGSVRQIVKCLQYVRTTLGLWHTHIISFLCSLPWSAISPVKAVFLGVSLHDNTSTC